MFAERLFDPEQVNNPNKKPVWFPGCAFTGKYTQYERMFRNDFSFQSL